MNLVVILGIILIVVTTYHLFFKEDLGDKDRIANSTKVNQDLVSLLPARYKSVDVASCKASLCIPCYEGHIEYLHELVESIDEQTVKPDEIVISLSSVSADLGTQTEAILKRKCGVPLFVHHTPNKQYAGINRNVCAEYASYDVLIYIDADDLMHPQRIEIVKRIMAVHPELKSMYHSYSKANLVNDREVFESESGQAIFARNVENGTIPVLRCGENVNGCGVKNKFQIHNGHAVIRRDVFDRVRYGDEYYSQDSIFNRRVLRAFGSDDRTVMHINLRLSYYRPQFSSHSH